MADQQTPEFGALRIAADGEASGLVRALVGEVPIAFEFNGIAYAVMMATPADLEDFAAGFCLTEGLIATLTDLEAPDIAETEFGVVLRAQIAGPGGERIARQARRRLAESSCGLCGIETLERIAQPLPRVAAHDTLDPAAVFRAMRELPDHQPHNRATGGSHAAAFAGADGRIVAVREDVGRHNALDKLIGAALRQGWPMASGWVLTTSRCSYEIVEKAVTAGACRLATVSVPTSLAVTRARAAGLTLYALARPDSVLRFSPAA